jgi:hypothetical protein
MSSACHVQVFNKDLRSWREFVRYAEFGACHHNEPSGSLHGLIAPASCSPIQDPKLPRGLHRRSKAGIGLGFRTRGLCQLQF